MDREDKRGIFFGVIGVLTLIVAIIGASLAYFSINASSDPDAIIVQSATVQIVYEDGNTLNVGDIIPSLKSVAERTFKRYLSKEEYEVKLPDETTTMKKYDKCIDDKGYTVCGSYDFSLTNNGPNTATITAKITPSEVESGNKFKNLKYALYDISNESFDSTIGSDGGEYSGLGTFVKEGTFSFSEDPETGEITYNEFNILTETDKVTLLGKQDGSETGEVKRYRLFVWLNEVDDKQDYEQGAVYKGTVHVEVANSEKITGTAAGA